MEKLKLVGEGVIITVDDSDIEAMDSNVLNALGLKLSDLLVHDGVLLKIVNELFIGGAEAVSINDERIISTTGIKCVGPVIQVNEEKVSPPYVIRAIGDKKKIKEFLNSSKVIEEYRKKTLKLQIEEKDNITIPGYTKELKLEYIVD